MGDEHARLTPSPLDARQFLEEVFPAERTEIARRRANAGVRPLPDDGERSGPTTSHDLVGLAFSGGGIRSASFCLGVLQRLISEDLFKGIDYLSTVSGGGYTGSCLSTLMHRGRDGERTFVDRHGVREPPALNHVRNGSDYLTPDGLLNHLRLPAVILVGALHTLLLMLPPIVATVAMTEAFFEATGRYLPIARTWLPVLGLAPLIAALFLRPALATLRSGQRTWAARDRAGRRLAAFLILAGCSLLAVPALASLDYLVNSGPAPVFDGLQRVFATGAESAARGRGWLLWGGMTVIGLLVLSVRRWGTRLVVPAVRAAGPLVVIGAYLLACLYVINSPVVTPRDGAPFVEALGPVYGNAPDEVTDGQRADVRRVITERLLPDKRMNPADYGEPELTVSERDAGQTGGPVYRDQVTVERSEGAAWWWRLMTTHRLPTLTIHLLDPTCLDRDQTECAVVIDELSLLGGHTEWWFYLGGLLLFLFNYTFVSVNRISLHGFYRDRLSRTFLIVPDTTGVRPADSITLSELGDEDSSAPYHLVNTALNLQGSADPQLRDRKTVPFLLAKRHCGSDHTGYCQTALMEREDPHFNLGTAMAISAAAAAPNMGTIKAGPLSFIMALLNLRLNYWLPNPARLSPTPGFAASLRGQPGLLYLWREATGAVDDTHALVNCSDGGHFENLAVYELVRRRCRTIVCVDGEADPDYKFHGFNTLQRYVEIDFGARITIDLDPLTPGEEGTSERQYAVGRITYANGEEGTFVYLKLSYSGTEPQYVRFYRKGHLAFPHESTGDQFFEETQFEVDRALGAHIADSALSDRAVRGPLAGEASSASHP